jgi:hypothetical protein
LNDHRRRRVIAAVGVLLLLTAVLLVIAGGGDPLEDPSAPNAATPTPEPIVPTRTLAADNGGESVLEIAAATTVAPTTTATMVAPTTTAVSAIATLPATIFATRQAGELTEEIGVETTAVPAQVTPVFSPVSSELARFGVSIARNFPDAEAAYALGLPFGSMQNWNVTVSPPPLPAEYWQMVRINQQGIRRVTWDVLAEAIAANPRSKWMVGNEPDVVWQDNVTPERYAEIYHEVYTFIKERDPDAQVAIGGVSQPTPLRRAYLDIVLNTYQERYGEPMPIDIWNVHAFTLREEADSWGVDIPPGMEGQEGILYEIEDHDNVDIIAGNLRDFRRWMADRGYGDTPLVISEYGILMPEDYGFPEQDVAAFMSATFDLFREMTGEEGYAPDDGRLVQWWFWYSVYDKDLYSTGNLWDEVSGQLTGVGRAWTQYILDNEIDADSEE